MKVNKLDDINIWNGITESEKHNTVCIGMMNDTPGTYMDNVQQNNGENSELLHHFVIEESGLMNIMKKNEFSSDLKDYQMIVYEEESKTHVLINVISRSGEKTDKNFINRMQAYAEQIKKYAITQKSTE